MISQQQQKILMKNLEIIGHFGSRHGGAKIVKTSCVFCAYKNYGKGKHMMIGV